VQKVSALIGIVRQSHDSVKVSNLPVLMHAVSSNKPISFGWGKRSSQHVRDILSIMEPGLIEVIAGVNLPMLIKLASAGANNVRS